MKEEQVALKPVTFINRLNNKKPSVSDTLKIVDVAAPSGRTDIALIDEAHLLRTQGNQAYQGHNMLLDVMRRAKVTVAVFDPAQILEGAQQWGGPDLGDQAAVGRPDADGLVGEVDDAGADVAADGGAGTDAARARTAMRLHFPRLISAASGFSEHRSCSSSSFASTPATRRSSG